MISATGGRRRLEGNYEVERELFERASLDMKGRQFGMVAFDNPINTLLILCRHKLSHSCRFGMKLKF